MVWTEFKSKQDLTKIVARILNARQVPAGHLAYILQDGVLIKVHIDYPKS